MRNPTSNSKSTVLFLIVILLIYGWQDVISSKAFAQTGLFVREMTNVDEIFSNFMDHWNIPGGSIAIVKDGRLVYARGFGYADKESREPVEPDHLFRIASVTKPITSIAIMKLIDERIINVDAKVFGTNGILNGPDYRTILDPRVKNITVRHLLQHTSGWGFINGNQDPMFSNEHISQRMDMNPPVGPVTVIKFMLRTQRLHNEPGVNYFYSNFGYCILGRIIELVSGKTYENYVKTELLNPLGISEMQLAQNLYENKAANEVTYYDFPGAPLVNSVYRRGERVPFPYGGFNIEAMDAHGGWIASASDLARLLVAVDGFDTKPDILTQPSIQLMITPSVANNNYSMGWAVNPWGNWWHIGDLPGTSSILVRTNHELGWAVLLNTRPSNLQNFLGQMDNVVWEAIRKIDDWPTHDLFEQTIAEIEETSTTGIKEASTVRTIQIPDQNLAATVRKALGLASNALITKQAMQRLTFLNASNRQIKNLMGLEHATQVKELNFNINHISNLSPLSGLTQLERLLLTGSQVSDVRPLAGLTRLKMLALGRNQISDVSPLARLTQLETLFLNDNQIRDVTPLAGLVNLRDLSLAENPIADASPLASLPKLVKVDIEISKPTPVVHVESSDHPPMYWVNTNNGTLYGLVDTEVENLLPNVRNATTLAVDVANEKLYWTEKTSNTTGRIRRANLDGTNVQLVKDLTSVPHGIALDTAAGKIYLTNSWGKVQRLNVDGSNFQPNLITELDTPRGIALDVAGGKVYWTEMTGHIRRANLDGTNIQDVITGLGTPMDLVVFDKTVYWTEKTGEKRGEIRSTKLNGAPNVMTRNTFTQGFPVGIVIDVVERTLYWTTSLGQIGRSNLDGSNLQPNFVTDLSAPGFLVLRVETMDIEPTVEVETPVVTPTDAVLSISPSSVVSPAVGERLMLNLNITAGEAVAGYQVTLQFDPTALRYVESSNADYLPNGTVLKSPAINSGSVELAATALTGDSNGDGTLAIVTFEVLTVKASTLTLSDMLLADSQGNTFLPQVEAGEITELPQLKTDVTGDGVVNILDLVRVANALGTDAPDLNGDGVVNILDLVIVANAF